MKENLIQEYYQKLIATDTPHLILSSFYSALFNKQLQSTEWGILRKAINIYGREVVFEALIRTATSTTLDTSKSIWPYVNSVALAISDNANKQCKMSSEVAKSLDRTAELLRTLQEIKPNIVRLISEEEFYGGTTTK